MTPRLSPEQQISQALRSVLGSAAVGAEIGETAELRDILSGLEYFLPSILSELYPYWKGESLDGFYLREARKVGLLKVQMTGVCVLISDQSVTPIHGRLRISPTEDKIEWMECRLGKRGGGLGDMERTPWSRWCNHPFVALGNSVEAIDWAYKVTFGAEEPER